MPHLKGQVKVLVSPLQMKKIMNRTSSESVPIIFQARRRKDEPLLRYTALATNIREVGEPALRGGGDKPKSIAEVLYEKNLQKAIRLVGHDHTTGRDELNEAAKKLFKSKYLGTFSKSEMESVQLTAKKPYAIVNTADAPGEHWQAQALHEGNVYTYDSYGIDGDTEPDAEQKGVETSCGQRCLAWLLVVKQRGLEEALEI